MLSKTKSQIIEVEKDRGSLFYNQYEWSVRWNQRYISVLRDGLDEFKVEKAIANARYWEQQRWKNTYRWSNTGRQEQDAFFRSEITPGVVADIHRARELLTGHQCKLVISMDSISVYTSDTQLRDTLIDHGQKRGCVVVTHANVIYPPDTVVLQNPQYKYRTYLRSREVSDENIEILKRWLEAQAGEIVASPGMKNFFKHRKSGYYYPTNYTADYFYFDHNDERYPTMLRMVLPVAIRKTVCIIAK